MNVNFIKGADTKLKTFKIYMDKEKVPIHAHTVICMEGQTDVQC